MTKKIFSWLGKEFVELSSEGKAEGDATEQAREIFQRFDQELKTMGLSLDHTVRSRLWGKDRESRDLGSKERVRVLSGKARSASSSYIAPEHFDSGASVALDLLAMRSSGPGVEKGLKEYDPPIVPLRYLVYDSLVVLSGVTAVLPTLEDQMADILPRITFSLADAGSSWNRVVKLSCYLHRSQRVEHFRQLLQKTVAAEIPNMEYSFVDGYSAEGKLVEIETTATR
ncbi:MAG TPA: RidA family protein [Candidatus Binatia bacterium]|jgi:enamine deaminase RidA (YjgF/YER057c/UK114 family)